MSSSFALAASFFKEQITENIFLEDVFFGIATICLLLVVMAVGLIDTGLVRRKNTLDTWIQKVLAALISGGAFLIIGYGVWQWQYYKAFGIPSPLSQAIKDWWLFGPNMTKFAHELDPKLAPSADVFQVFGAFFVAYAAVWAALLHSAGLERVKAKSMYILAFLGGGVMMPIMVYLTWGSVSPLTNRGVHDYLGIFSLYIFVGVWAVILAWRAGPRIGAFTKDPRTTGPHAYNLGTSASGTALLLFATPFLALGCGFLIADSGYFGISMTTSGFGIVFLNVCAAFVGGSVGGGLLAYRLKNPLFVVLGPVAGYVSCAATLDIGRPWECAIIAFFGPAAFMLVYELLKRARIDEKKVAPLGLGCGIYGAIVAGFIGNGDKTGGYFGLTGEYGFQNASISPGWQLAGVGVTVGVALISGLVFIIGLEKTLGLRVSEEVELAGLDASNWLSPPPTGLDEPAYGPDHTPVEDPAPLTAR
jgi:Amt family ammonium transporter